VAFGDYGEVTVLRARPALLAGCLVAVAVAAHPVSPPAAAAAPAPAAAPAAVTPAPMLLAAVAKQAAPAEPSILLREPVRGAAPTAAGVRRALAPLVADRALGPRVGVAVTDAETGRVLFAKSPDLAVTPASTMKLVTAVTALTVLPRDTVFSTRLLATAPTVNGVVKGDLVLVGDGDATLTSVAEPAGYPEAAGLSAFAAAVKRAGITRVTGDVLVDGSRYTGPSTAPGWKPTYVTEGSVAPVTALTVDSGRQYAGSTRGPRVNRPDYLAGQRFVTMVRGRGVRIDGTVRRGVAPAGAVELATVASPPVPALVERMLQRSDNNLAEALLRRSARERGLPESFAGGARVARAVLAELGVPSAGLVVRDGSGLSRQDRVSPATLAALVAAASSDGAGRLRALLPSLAAAGFNGTLAGRYRAPATATAAGVVRGKTGTLNHVTTLAGVVTTRSGHLLTFAVVADAVPTPSVGTASRAVDRAVARLATCGCP
jgi:D-alanyl-D-alanine carboxypeptidase/D-alanyl-D-alanine-endopeptidase (penicillin-binding protein 4)